MIVCCRSPRCLSAVSSARKHARGRSWFNRHHTQSRYVWEGNPRLRRVRRMIGFSGAAGGGVRQRRLQRRCPYASQKSILSAPSSPLSLLLSVRVVLVVVPLLSTVAIASADWPAYASLSAVDWPFRMTARPSGWSSWPPCPRMSSVLCSFCVYMAVHAHWPIRVPRTRFVALSWHESLRGGVCPPSQGNAGVPWDAVLACVYCRFCAAKYVYAGALCYLAHSANLPEGLYILLALISFFF